MSEAHAYAGDAIDELPLGAYAALMLAFAGGFGALLALGSRRRRLPSRISAGDVLLLGVATHQLTRIVTRDRITAALRFPFTRYEGNAGAGELHERPRGRGLKRAMGSLVSCQFCAGPWAAASLTSALVVRPRETRVVASMLSMVAVSDFLHQAYAYARRAS